MRTPATTSLARLRRAMPADAAGVAAVHRQSWFETYTGLLPDSVVLGRSVGEFRRLWAGGLAPNTTWTTRVAEVPHGPLVGFATTGPLRQPARDPHGTWRGDLGDRDGELIALYLLRAHHGYGLGRALFEAARADLAAAGFRRMAVRVLATNPTVGFYAKLGGRTVTAADRLYRGTLVREVTYAWDLAAARDRAGP